MAIMANGFMIAGTEYGIASAEQATYDSEGNLIKEYSAGAGIQITNHVISYVGGGGGGMTQVQHDTTLTGDGASQTSLLGVTPGLYAEPNGSYSANGLTALSANGAYSAKNANMATNVQYVNSVAASTVISRLNGLTAQSATWNEVSAITAKADQTDLTSEITTRENSDRDLQAQIDAITSQTDVVDIVGSYAELQAYDTSTLYVDDIIKILVDETRNDAITYYRWKGGTTWDFIGASGPFYTKAETENTFIAKNSQSATNWNSVYNTVTANSATKWNTTVTANDTFVTVSKGSGPDYTVASNFISVTAMPSNPQAGKWYFVVE